MRALTIFCLLLCSRPAHALDSLYFSIVRQDGWYRAIDRQGRTLADSLTSEEHYPAAAEGMFPYFRNGRTGFKDHHNRVVIQPAYRFAEGFAYRRYPERRMSVTTVFQNGLAIISGEKGKFGIIDRKGRLTADTVYDWISSPEPQSGNYAARIGDQLMILDRNGNNLLSKAYWCDTGLFPTPAFADGLLCVMMPQNGDRTRSAYCYRTSSDLRGIMLGSFGDSHRDKVGFVDAQGRLVIDLVYDINEQTLGDHEEDARRQAQAYPAFEPPQFIFPVRTNSPKPEPHYLNKDYYRFEGGRCLVFRNGNNLIIDVQGNVLATIPDERQMQLRNHRGCFIRSYAKEVLPSWARKVEQADEPVQEHSIYNRNEQCIWTGNCLVDTGDTEIFLIEGKGRWRYVDGSGRHRFEGKYIPGTLLWYFPKSPFFEGFADIRLDNNSRWMMDSLGNIYSSRKYLDLAWSGELICARDRSGQYGMIDTRKRWIIKPVYRQLHPFHAGLALAAPEAYIVKYGFINERGEWILPAIFDGATDFIGTMVYDD